MSVYSKSGHPRNVANFEGLIASVTSFGAAFAPSKASCKLPAMNALLTSCRAVLSIENTAESMMSLVVNARKTAFKALGKLVTRINSSLRSTDTSIANIESAASLVRKLHGRRASPKLSKDELAAAEAAGNKVVQKSASRMSYDNQLENMDRLIKQLQTNPSYNPSEADLKLTALTAFYNDLKTKNTSIATAQANLSIAKINRNDLLYKADVGLVDVAQDVKMYVRSVFGATSPQYHMVCRFKFVRFA